MLTDRDYRLLTTAVDGELSPAEQQSFDVLLANSVDARDCYGRLQADAMSLRNLPKAQLPQHFGTEIVRKLSSREFAKPSQRNDRLARRLPIWANAAAALAVLFAVSLGTYLVMTLSDKGPAVAKKNVVPESPATGSPPIPNPPSIASNGNDVAKKTEPESLPLPRDAVVEASNPPIVEPGSKGVLAANPRPGVDRLFVVELPKLAPILAVRDIDQNGSKQQLLEVLKKNEGVHLDLFCKDTNRAFDRLQAAFRGQKLLIDAVASERLQRKLKTHYVFYTEALNADEILGVLQTLAAEERRSEVKKENQFDKLVANPMSPNSLKTLSMLLGIDPKSLNRPKSAAPIDPTKPLSDSTADSLTKSLKGSSTRGERLVLVLPYNPIRPNPLASKEVRQFLDHASVERRPGTVPMLLVLRSSD
jgi:anti-sigma-K factor RskA